MLIFHIILECIKHSLNNREDNPSQVCKQWYFLSSDVISGNFLTRLFPVGNSSSKNARSANIVVLVESDSKVFFSVFSCYVGVVLYDTG